MISYSHLHLLDSEHSIKMDQAWLVNLLETYGVNRVHPSDALEEGAFVFLQGQEHAEMVDEVMDRLNQMPWAVVLVTSDECTQFPYNAIQHRDHIRWCVQTPRHIPYPIGTSFLPLGSGNYQRGHLHYSDTPTLAASERPIWASFRGQAQNEERLTAVEYLRQIDGDIICEVTDGFFQGLPHEQYLEELENTTFAICPPGTCTNDSFRVYEALEAGAIPIVCNRGPLETDRDRTYWRRIGMDWLPIVSAWENLPQTITQLAHMDPDIVQAHLAHRYSDYRTALINTLLSQADLVRP